MKFWKLTLAITILFFGTLSSKSFAQEIKADVTVNMERLEFEARTNVSTLERDLEEYLNNQKFLPGEWEGDPINMYMTIYLSGGANNRYEAKVYIYSTRALDGPDDAQSINVRFYDDAWSFEYARGANLTYNPDRFDPFVSFVDYYALLIIGFDLDTYEELGGSQAFAAARKIAELGASRQAPGFDVYASAGEFTKYNLVKELTNPRFDEFRRLTFGFFVDGLDLMASDKEKAIANLEDIFYYMAKYKKEKLVEQSVLAQLFFDSHARQIASIFNGRKDSKVFDYLKYLDPGNSALYEEAREGKIEN